VAITELRNSLSSCTIIVPQPKFGLLRDNFRNPPRPILAEQLGRRSPARLIRDIGKLLAVVGGDDKEGGLFLEGPRRREAARCHR
jgi:hypothetical protein